MATIDIDALREYLRDYYGTAMMAGLWPAVADLGRWMRWTAASCASALRSWASTCGSSW